MYKFLCVILLVATFEVIGASDAEQFDPLVTLHIESGSLLDEVVVSISKETGFNFIISNHVKDRAGISLEVDLAPVLQAFVKLRDVYGICAWRYPRPTPHNVVTLEACGVPQPHYSNSELFPPLEDPQSNQ